MKSHRIPTQFVIGLVVVILGVILLLGSVGLLNFGDVFRWTPSLVILYALWLLVRSRLRNIFFPSFLILAAGFGQLILLGIDIGDFWPVILIVLGAIILINGIRSSDRRESVVSRDTDQSRMDVTCVMGSVRERIVSDEFKGGQAAVVMGEAKLDLRESSITEKPASIEVTVVMGEMKLRVPDEWNVRVENVTIMGESGDERLRCDTQSSQADLVIGGAVLMGSLKIED